MKMMVINNSNKKQQQQQQHLRIWQYRTLYKIPSNLLTAPQTASIMHAQVSKV